MVTTHMNYEDGKYVLLFSLLKTRKLVLLDFNIIAMVGHRCASLLNMW